jgi:hypothetical protein
VNAALARFEIGKPFVSGRPGGEASASVSFSEDAAVVALVVPALRAEVIEAVRSGILTYAWVGSPHGALLCVTLADEAARTVADWTDIPYHVGTDVRASVGDRPVDEQMAAALVLVDAGSGEIAAVREHAWPAPVAGEIRATLESQRQAGFDPRAKLAWLTEIRARYSSVQDLAKAADQVWTDGAR